MAGSVSPRMNTIASRDQFKPIRIGENVMANYNICYDMQILRMYNFQDNIVCHQELFAGTAGIRC